MKKLIIEGGKKLSGTINISGAKNSVVALIPASILTKGKCVIHNVPDISDVGALMDIMKFLGSDIKYENETIYIDNKNVTNKYIPDEYANRLRASYYFMGSLLGVYGKVDIASPGGCVIGSRPMDFHLKSFEKMGAVVTEKNNSFYVKSKGLKATEVFFDVPSVGATINVMIAAVRAEGTTRILNAAREPEIENIADFLISMGAKITGAGTGTVIIEGVKTLGDGEITVIPDRIEAGTYVIMGALLGDKFQVSGVVPEHIESLLYKLKEMGAKYTVKGNTIKINKCNNLKAVNIKTTVYPGYPTDLGQPISTLLTQCKGESIFEETIYENRLRHVPYLNGMGAKINALDKKAIVSGPTPLVGRKVKATDLRAGASMLVAGMIATGTTTVTNVEHLLRGYERIVDKLNNVGAKIKLVDE